MKKTFLILLALTITMIGYSQIKVYTVEAVDSLILNGEGMYIDPITSTDGQVLRRVNGSWINYDFTATGTDSLVFDPIWGYLYDYRGGSVFKTTPVQYENFTLNNGDTRIITIRYADGGNEGDDLIIKAGDNDDNIGGGDLYLRGGGSYEEYGDVYLGTSDYDGNKVYVEDSIKMNGNSISGLPEATLPTEPVILSQMEGISKSVYSIALPYNTTVQARVNGATEGTDYPTGWELSAGVNSIDLEITHGLGRRVANINVCTVSGTAEQLLRPFAGGYSGWQTTDENTLLINALATTPLPLKIYIIFE